MQSEDARRLSPQAQEALRLRVMTAVRTNGLPVAQAARTFGVSRAAIYNWTHACRQRGTRALRGTRRGRPTGIQLQPQQAALTVKTLVARCPDQLRLPFALWTREAVGLFLERRFGVQLSVWTVGRYLKRWGLTPQKPVRRAYERDPAAVRTWLKEEYPGIRRAAKRDKAEIHWGDQMGLRSDHQTGTSYGKRGQTPGIPGTGQRFRCNMMSTITNRGQLAFMVFTTRFTAAVMLAFLHRLVRHQQQRIYLIVDRHPVHRSAKVQAWLARHRRQVRLFFLPSYSPDLNPDEYLNQDVKSNALGRQRPAHRDEMIDGLRSYLRSTQRRSDIVRNYFHADSVRYAAA